MKSCESIHFSIHLFDLFVCLGVDQSISQLVPLPTWRWKSMHTLIPWCIDTGEFMHPYTHALKSTGLFYILCLHRCFFAFMHHAKRQSEYCQSYLLKQRPVLHKLLPPHLNVWSTSSFFPRVSSCSYKSNVLLTVHCKFLSCLGNVQTPDAYRQHEQDI